MGLFGGFLGAGGERGVGVSVVPGVGELVGTVAPDNADLGEEGG